MSYRRHPNGAEDDFYSTHVPQENDDLINGLRSKVTTLKSLTLDMGDEIKEHNRFLGTMNDDAESVWASLGGSMKRLTRIASAGHNRVYLYLFVFALFVFLTIYLILKTR